MRLFIYGILFVLALIVFKAFYLDSMKTETPSEENASAEMPKLSTDELFPAPKYEGNVSGMGAPKKEKVKPSYSDMPLERLGDSIADTVK